MDAHDPRPRVRLSTPVDVIAAVPYLLGFHPQQSLVAVGLDGKRLTFAGRSDLPPAEGGPADCAGVLLPPLAQARCREAIVVGYAAPELATPAVDALRAELRRAGIGLREALRVTDGRYWSYTCPRAACCPPEGTAVDPCASPAPAALIAAGLSACADREELAASVAPLTGRTRAVMRAATRRAERRCRRRWGGHLPADLADHEAVDLVVAGARGFTHAGVGAMRSLADRLDQGGTPPSTPEAMAWTLLLLRSLPARDEIWSRIRPENLERHLAMWVGLLRHAEPRYRAAPGCLAAFTAWQTGQGGLANLALDAVTEVDPGYSMAALLRDTLARGIPPDAWSYTDLASEPKGLPGT